MKPVPRDLLASLAGNPPDDAFVLRANPVTRSFDLAEWISTHDLDVRGPTPWQGGRRWVFPACPWNPEHKDSSAYIVQHANGAIAAGCHHNGCAANNWYSLRDLVEPGRESRSTGNERKGTRTRDSGNWDPPVPFSQFDLPTFPANRLPDWIRVLVEAEATATQTPVDLAAMLALSVVAAACAKKVVIRLKQGYVEPLNIFTVTALPPGNRKSTVFADTTRPFQEFEEAEARRADLEISRQEAGLRIKQAKLKKLEHEAASAKPQEQGSIVQQVNELAEDIARSAPRPSPKYIVDDCTPERLSTLIAEQGGRIAVMSPEGDVFDLMAGRYSANAGATNLGIYLRGHAGDTLRVDRVGRPTEFVKSPALTIGLAVQPDVIRGLTDKPGFRGRGLLARFLYSLPASLLGRRDTSPPPVPPEVLATYRSNVFSLLELPLFVAARGEQVPHVLV